MATRTAKTGPRKRTKKKASAAGPVTVQIVQLPHAKGLALPAYQTAGAAGLDLVAAVAETAPVMLLPRTRALVPTGLVLALPEGHEAQVRPRSGLALKHGVTVLNAPGTIDADYRGEVQVILVNFGSAPYEVRRGERIAQLVIQPVAQALLVEVEAVAETDRGAGGFGSTGLKTSGQKPTASAKPAAKKNAVPRKPAATKPASRASRAAKPGKAPPR